MRTYQQLLDMDEHAVLWPDLTIRSRCVDGPEDITVGQHPVLGFVIVSHFGLDELVTWTTRKPIPDELTD